MNLSLVELSKGQESRWAPLAGNLLRAGSSATSQAWCLSVPGRIEVLGKHTDYAGGQTLVTALEATIDAVCVPTNNSKLRVLEDGEGLLFREIELEKCGSKPTNWERFPTVVAHRLTANFGRLNGVDVIFKSRIPRSAGASSSSALIVLFYLALARRNNLNEHPRHCQLLGRPEDLVTYLGCIENGQTFGQLSGDHGVGTNGGSEDHAAIALSVRGKLQHLSFCPLRLQTSVALPEGLRFLVASSGVQASKSGAQREAYNRLSLDCEQAASYFRQSTGRNEPHLGAAIRSAGAAALLETLEPRPELKRRAQHFALESEHLVPSASHALSVGDLNAFCDLVSQSQRAAEELLGNQTSETKTLVACARASGALAASSFGAGFGGSAWALVHEDRAQLVLEAWRHSYQALEPEASQKSVFLTSGAGAAASWHQPHSTHGAARSWEAVPAVLLAAELPKGKA